MKKLFYLLVTVSAMLGGFSCRTAVQKEVSEKPESGTVNMVSVGNTMLKAFQKEDYAEFSKNFYPGLKKDFNASAFEQGRRQISETVGKMQNCRYLGILAGPVFSNYLWAVEFSRKSADGKEIVQEMLFKVSAAELDGKLQVVSFGFML